MTFLKAFRNKVKKERKIGVLGKYLWKNCCCIRNMKMELNSKTQLEKLRNKFVEVVGIS